MKELEREAEKRKEKVKELEGAVEKEEEAVKELMEKQASVCKGKLGGEGAETTKRPQRRGEGVPHPKRP